MKKSKRLNTGIRNFMGSGEILLKMKLTSLFILLGIVQVLAFDTYAQSTKLTIDLNNVSVEDALRTIEDQSEFYFVYNKEAINVNRKVNLDVKNQTVDQILDNLFENTNVNYEIKSRHIILSTLQQNQPEKTVTGKVTNKDGEPIPGVTVVVKGTVQGTITNMEGSYTIAKVAEDATLLFSFVGMIPQEMAVAGTNVINVEMEEEMIGIGEVVAIGYGTTTVKDATGAISSVSSDDFNKGMVASPEQLIQGRSAGVQITSGSGEPGSSININIRGTSSVRSGNNPLYVVDGVPLSGDNVSPEGANVSFGSSTAKNPLNFLNPDDIKDISILKDASATAIYGSRGANGVVIITTKSGKGAGSSIEYSSMIGISNITKKYDVLNREEYLSAVANLGSDPTLLDAGKDTDWQDQIFRTGISQSHNISFGNSDESGNYRVSMGYFDQEGIIKESGMKRYTVRVNGNRNFFDDKLKLGSQLTVSSIDDMGVPIGNTPNHYGDLIASALYMNPTEPVMIGDEYNQPSQERLNPAAMLAYSADNTSTFRALASLSAEYQISENLSFKTIYGYDISKSDRTYAYSPLLYANYIYENGKAGVSTISMNNSLWENFINYKKEFGNVRFTGLLGYSYQSYTSKTSSLNAGKFRFDDIDLMMNNIAAGESIVGNSSYEKDELQSYFARVNFVANDKFLFTATMRADGSTKFGGNNKYGYFPSMALGYRLSEEDFIPEAFSNLKLRLGWGVTGNQEIPHNLYSQRKRYGSSSIDGSGNISTGSLGDVTFANPDLKWETTSQFNAGIDFGFVNNRVRGTLDVYQKKTTDLLLRLSSAQPAPQSFYWSNLDGNIYNSGVELSLTTDIVAKSDFDWSVTGNVSYNKNIVKDLFTNIETGGLDGQGLSGVTIQRITNDYPMYTYYIRVFEGFDADGIAIYDGDNPQYTGDSPIPKVTAGLTSTIRYKNFDFNVYFNAQMGHKIYSNTANAFFYAGNLAIGKNVTKDIVGNGEAAINTADPSTRFLEDGSFVRLQDVTLGYTIPFKSSAISNVRLFVTGQNLFVITGYSGQDPEVNVNKDVGGVPSMGIDYTTYPRSRTILMGIKVKF